MMAWSARLLDPPTMAPEADDKDQDQIVIKSTPSRCLLNPRRVVFKGKGFRTAASGVDGEGGREQQDT